MTDTSGSLTTQSGTQSLIARARGALSQLNGVAEQPAIRRALPAVLIVGAAALGLLAYLLLTPPDRVGLQTGLPEAEKGRALEVLVAGGFNAQLDPATGGLTVNSDEYHRARMALALEGLPQGTPDGLSTITDMPMGTSRSVEAARLRRMQELDLAQSIAELQPVRSARVHLALPERTAFVRDTQPPRASVFLQIAPGMALTETQVRAVVSLVSTAVPNMPHENVSVVDQTGRLLSNDSNDPLQGQTDRELRHQLQLERLYRDRIVSLVSPIVGSDNVAVEVTLDMDFTRSEVTSEEYNPRATAVRSEQESMEESTSPQARGIPGAVSNTPPNEADLTAAGPAGNTQEPAKSKSSSTTRNYEVSRRVETTTPQTAQIKRVNAAILLRAPKSDDPTAPATLDPTLMEEVERLAKSAVGFENQRGDIVTVSSTPFVETFSLPEPAWHEAQWLPQAGRVLAQVVILGIVILGVVRPLLDRMLPAASSPVDHMPIEVESSETVEVAKGETLQALRARLHGSAPDADDLNGAISYEEKVELLRAIAGAESGRIANVFQAMIAPPQEEEDA
ncbi:flagellar basal-body MS-ring/collar protein FliF [Pseudoprimorskyibacter insulae]|uniref:Flagellar M-ring protein n=1 Tax=Pseudoprimorskyibacter insulae TaxID=1695997 RepID=A0A2R8AVP9_9RHOB|nr:flagellar basal-body MS-ring/collar protein FliF [Pseudoprimorskyibacter insulae]SPF80080.1 Flagellar M-ring protein [Pseudoprimorskyibacter insulae]